MLTASSKKKCHCAHINGSLALWPRHSLNCIFFCWKSVLALLIHFIDEPESAWAWEYFSFCTSICIPKWTCHNLNAIRAILICFVIILNKLIFFSSFLLLKGSFSRILCLILNNLQINCNWMDLNLNFELWFYLLCICIRASDIQII